MNGEDTSDPAAIREAFRGRLRRDRRRGEERSLDDYLREYPGHESTIEEEYARLRGNPRRSSASSRSTPLRTIAHYELIRELGRGGQGVVYLARDSRLERDVALKLLHGAAMASDVVLERFKREARAVSQLDHPGICTVYDAGTTDGLPWIVMRYVEGENLGAMMARHSSDSTAGSDTEFIDFSSSAENAGSDDELTTTASATRSTRKDVMAHVELAEKTARALHAAHSVGLVHRDVKPGNIVVTSDHEPVILDFGLARLEGADDELTRTGDVLGTPAYMSPEQVENALDVDYRTDVYSLGATLYEMVTGRRPVEAPTRERLYRAILSEKPIAPRKLNRAVPADLEIILETALEKDVRRRYGSAEAFAEDLRRLREHEPILARPVSRAMRMRRWFERHPALGATLAILMLSLVAGTATTLTQWLRAEENKRGYERLSDLRLAVELEDEANALWPPDQELVPAMLDWLDRAERLVKERLPLHERDLAELEALAASRANDDDGVGAELADLRWRRDEIGRKLEADQASLAKVLTALESNQGVVEDHEALRDLYESRIDELTVSLARTEEALKAAEVRRDANVVVKFEVPADAWRYDRLRKITSALRRLQRDDPFANTIPAMRERVETARLLQRKHAERSARWAECQAELRENRWFPDDFVLTPLRGLVPLGRDPDSDFQEFAVEMTGEVPERDEYGDLPIDSDSAIVLVLLPELKGGIGRLDGEAHGADERGVFVWLAPFLIGKHEVTQAQWARVMGDDPSEYSAPKLRSDSRITISSSHPVESISWIRASEFCRRVGGVLPTAAQWEVACGAGRKSPFWWGPDFELRDNIADESAARFTQTTFTDLVQSNDGWPVHAPITAELLEPNPFGITAMHGNVAEWCRDRYCSFRSFDLAKPGEGMNIHFGLDDSREIRGGSWFTPAGRSRTSIRGHAQVESRHAALGMRLGWDLVNP